MKLSQQTKSAGFTMLELMIAVVIMAILAAIAIPSYQRYVTKARMQEAAAKLQENYLYMEKMYSKNNAYLMTKGGSAIKKSNLPFEKTGTGNVAYDFSISEACSSDTGESTATAFCLKATPKSGQMQSAGGGKECGILMVDQSGQYYIKPENGSMSTDTTHDGVSCF